jgi:Mor family transcriptional regulator
MATKELPELLGQIHEAMREALTVAGLSGDDLETYALRGCQIIQKRVFNGGGMQVYISSEHTTALRIRNREIIRKAKRLSIRQLCAEYPELSETRIRHILNPPPSAFHRKPKPAQTPRKKNNHKETFSLLQQRLF